MSQLEADNALREKIRHLAIEQMSEGIVSLIQNASVERIDGDDYQ